MMLKQKSNPWARLKYLYVLPLTAVAVVAFARPEISRELEKISSAKINEIVPVKETVDPKKAEPAVGAVSVSQDTNAVKTQSSPEEKKEITNPLESMQRQLDDFSQDAEARMRKIKQQAGGVKIVSRDSADLDLPGGVTVHMNGGYIGKEKPLVIIDGVEQIGGNAIEKLNPDDIESISVMKDGSAVKKYGEKAKGGVILIVTKNALRKKAE